MHINVHLRIARLTQRHCRYSPLLQLDDGLLIRDVVLEQGRQREVGVLAQDCGVSAFRSARHARGLRSSMRVSESRSGRPSR